MLIKQESITSQKLGSHDFRRIADSVLNKGKYAISPLFNGPEVLSSASDKAKLFPENFSMNSNLDFKLINMRNILFYLFHNHKNIRTYEIKNMRVRRIIPYRPIFIAGLSLVGKLNILL